MTMSDCRQNRKACGVDDGGTGTKSSVTIIVVSHPPEDCSRDGWASGIKHAS